MILDDGTLHTFGRGDFGQLGHGDQQNQASPKRVEVEAWQGRRVTSVACGEYHTAVILDDGTLHTFGSGGSGRLGHGDEQKQASPSAWRSRRGRGAESRRSRAPYTTRP